MPLPGRSLRSAGARAGRNQASERLARFSDFNSRDQGMPTLLASGPAFSSFQEGGKAAQGEPLGVAVAFICPQTLR